MSKASNQPCDLIPYLEAMKIIKERYSDISFEEFAMWVFFGGYHYFDEDPDDPDEDSQDWREANDGGFKSYFENDKDMRRALDLFGRVDEGDTIKWEEIRQNLHLRRFSRAEMETFTPPDRWISCEQLLRRWSKLIDKDDAAAKISNLRMDFPVRIVDQTKDMFMYSRNEADLMEQEFRTQSSELGTKQNPNKVSEVTTNWMLQVQAQAAILWEKLQKMGCKPTKNSIKDDLAKWCRENNVRTRTQIFPDAAYIYRHALRNWTPPKKTH